MKKSVSEVCGVLVLLTVVIVLSGCPSSSGGLNPDLPEGASVEKNSSLFVTDSGSGVTSFSTNDTKYTGEYGYTLWTEGDTVYSPFTHLEVTLSKMSGNEDAGYGVVFCSHDSTMLLVLINIKKEYLIGELDGNVFSEIQGWEESSDLLSGYNRTNVVDISLDSGAGEFSLGFNGGSPVTFRDDEEPYHTGGRNGYIVVVSPREDFPEVPVVLTFRDNPEGL